MPEWTIEPDGKGFFKILNVPIFQQHTNRGFDCNDEWMQDAITDFTARRAQGYRPVIVVGHNDRNTKQKLKVEKKAYGFLDNLRQKGQLLYADMVKIPAKLMAAIKSNHYPNRSVEILPRSRRILALALLGGTSPHFTLPQMVFKNEEESIWFRSPEMGMSAEDKQEIMEMFQEAVQSNALPGVPEDELEVYELDAEEFNDYMNAQEDLPEMFDGEDGYYYFADDDGEYYAVKKWLINKALKGRIGARRAKRWAKRRGQAAKDQMVNARIGARRAKRRVKREGRMLKEDLKERAKRMRDWARRNPGKTTALAAAGGGAVGADLGTSSAIADNYINEMTRREKQRYAADLGEGFELDYNTGELFYEGNKVGEVVPTAADPETIRETSSPNPNIQPHEDVETTGLEQDPGDPETDLIEELDDEDDNSVINNELMMDEESARLYDLEHQVSKLQTANQLLQAGRKFEHYKQYLTEAKQRGCPVGDVDQTVDFMMQLDEEQIQKFQQQLESSPKVSLGKGTQVMQFNDNFVDELEQDYQQHANDYQAMGVNPEDLQYAQYVRVNGSSS
jgi:hypothetical protein